MEVVVAAGGHIPSFYAHSFNVMKMAQGYSDLGHRVEVVAPLSIPLLIKKWRIGDIHDFYGVKKNLFIKFLNVYSLRTIFATTNFKEFDRRAAKYCKERSVDLAHCRSYRIPYYCVKLGVPTIIETHTTNYDHPDLQKIYTVIDKANFLGLVTQSQIIKKEHVKRGIPEEKIIAIGNGVDLNRFEINDDKYFWRENLDLPKGRKLVVYCGHLYEEKGIEHILLTAKKLSKYGVIFVLVGGFDKFISRWKNYCEEKKIGNVLFTGFVDNSDVPKYLKAADVLMMPYDTNVNYKVMNINTTSPIKLFEYMASKRPIVSTDIPAISKILDHEKTGMLAKPNDIEELSHFVSELLNNLEKSKQLSEKAYRIVKKYTWKKRCQKILSKLLYCQ